MDAVFNKVDEFGRLEPGWQPGQGVEATKDMFDVSLPAPRPEWIRGKCPTCGDHLISNCYYAGSRGYIICWECWGSLKAEPTCTYRKVI